MRAATTALAAIVLLAGCKKPTVDDEKAPVQETEAPQDTSTADPGQPEPDVDVAETVSGEPTSPEEEIEATAPSPKKKKKGKKKGDEAILKTMGSKSPFGADSALYTGKEEGLGGLVGPGSNVGGIGLRGGGETVPLKDTKKKSK